MIELASIIIYPVKSCRGIALNEWAFGRDGLLHDREFLVVDAEGTFITQRTVPGLALIETALSDDALILCAAGLEELRVPWQIADTGADVVERNVTIWHDTVRAVDAGDAAAAWLSHALGQPCRLVRRGAAFSRFLPERRIPSHVDGKASSVPVSFADAFPILVISEESLADLNDRLDESLPMERFRPNLVVRGCAEPFAEDTWATFRIGGGILHAGGECVRCVMTTVDQQTGVRQGKEPLRTLALYRRDHGDGNGVVFGQNVIPEGSGQLRIGDPVEIVKWINRENPSAEIRPR